MFIVIFLNRQGWGIFAKTVVMYIEKVPNRNSPAVVLRPDSYREGDQVKKRTFAKS
ncbi:transposase [Microcystis aeruginosa NIES-3804]|uniref:Transposase n=1 Tax=Microcystis aeruginosa NIES-3804 TaxID=2517783 RepID=A0A6H9GJS0_MICAE|nr:transposase [Microcystis aeruginosa NIES-3804]